MKTKWKIMSPLIVLFFIWIIASILCGTLPQLQEWFMEVALGGGFCFAIAGIVYLLAIRRK